MIKCMYNVMYIILSIMYTIIYTYCKSFKKEDLQNHEIRKYTFNFEYKTNQCFNSFIFLHHANSRAKVRIVGLSQKLNT